MREINIIAYYAHDV